jgi:hypothetical protein
MLQAMGDVLRGLGREDAAQDAWQRAPMLANAQLGLRKP